MQRSATYEEAMRSKFPMPLAIAVARNRDGLDNPITLGWWMSTSHVPPMLAISIGMERYSLEVIRYARSFVLAFPSVEMAGDTRYFGSFSGRTQDKLAKRMTKLMPATRIQTVLLSDAVANFECALASEHVTGDHVILVGEVVASHINTNGKTNRLYTLARSKSVLRLGGVEGV
jgi:flavin reductase (DIM6/NTAB) family NADH-FMN oxidoreductase RutF